MSARKNLCIHPRVSKGATGRAVDAGCMSMTAPWVRESHDIEDLCSFYEGLESCLEPFYQQSEKGNSKGNSRRFLQTKSAESAAGSKVFPYGVYTLDDLKELGKRNGTCPYFLVRRLLAAADVSVYAYSYLVDPKVAENVLGTNLARTNTTIVVFDEAHNIDNVCLESMSVELTKASLDAASRSLRILQERVEQVALEDHERLQEEYESLLEGLTVQSQDNEPNVPRLKLFPDTDLLRNVGVQVVPGSIRKADHFLAFLKRILAFMHARFKTKHVISETTAGFLAELKVKAAVGGVISGSSASDKRALKLCSERLASLTQTLQLTAVEELAALGRVAIFVTLAASYEEGFLVLFEPVDEHNDTACLHLACLDATIAMRPVLERFPSVIITSGTLSPLSMYPQLLDFTPVLAVSLPNTLFNPRSLQPMIVTRGTDQTPLSSRFEIRNDPSVVRNYGLLLLEMAKVTPDGLVGFFPSYLYMHHIIGMWEGMGLLGECLQHKLIFVETPDGRETAVLLEAYRRACDIGRGAIMLCVARGKVSEGVDFEGIYGRCVIMFGIPYQYTESRLLKSRLEYMRECYGIRENDYLTFDALRHAAQCLGRVLRTKTDYGLMILADKRYSRADKRRKLPVWLAERITEGNADCGADYAVHAGQSWFTAMAARGIFDVKNQIGQALWSTEDIAKKGPDFVQDVLQLRTKVSNPAAEETNFENEDEVIEAADDE